MEGEPMESKERQPVFSDAERSVAKKQTGPEKFLSEKEAVVPFSLLLSLEAFYPRHPKGEGHPIGRR